MSRYDIAFASYHLDTLTWFDIHELESAETAHLHNLVGQQARTDDVEELADKLLGLADRECGMVAERGGKMYQECLVVGCHDSPPFSTSSFNVWLGLKLTVSFGGDIRR